MVCLSPRGPNKSEGPDLLKLSVTPGTSCTRLKNLKDKFRTLS